MLIHPGPVLLQTNVPVVLVGVTSNLLGGREREEKVTSRFPALILFRFLPTPFHPSIHPALPFIPIYRLHWETGARRERQTNSSFHLEVEMKLNTNQLATPPPPQDHSEISSFSSSSSPRISFVSCVQMIYYHSHIRFTPERSRRMKKIRFSVNELHSTSEF